MTDEQLIRQFRETGDPTALDTVVSRHIGRVRGMIYTMVLNDADADDVTQEVFLKAINRLSSFRNASAFSTWLHRIAVNTARSFLRRRGRDRLVFGEAVPEESDPRPSAPAHAAAREQERAMEEALAQLPLPLRSAFSMVVLQEMTPREAARAEGCFLSTIYRRVDAAREALGRALGGAA
jgi:RNA polymerase sigma-70 factor (ECF subfamily)